MQSYLVYNPQWTTQNSYNARNSNLIAIIKSNLQPITLDDKHNKSFSSNKQQLASANDFFDATPVNFKTNFNPQPLC